MDAAAEEPSFFADVMLGRLARWLRILGYDTRYERDFDDGALVGACETEGRILLTRDSAMTLRSTRARMIFMASEKPLEQVRQLARACGVRISVERIFTRCTWCNGALEIVPAEAAAGRVPPYVLSTNRQFRRCPVCDKLYWRGTHHDRFIDLVNTSIGAE